LKKIENEGHGRPFQVLEMRKTNPVIADIEMRHPEMPIIKLDPAQIFAPVSPVGRGGCHLGTKSIGCPHEAMALLEFRSKQVSAHLEVWISLGPEKSFLSLLLNLRMVKYGKGIYGMFFLGCPRTAFPCSIFQQVLQLQEVQTVFCTNNVKKCKKGCGWCVKSEPCKTMQRKRSAAARGVL
jgi:hypothetical protein